MGESIRRRLGLLRWIETAVGVALLAAIAMVAYRWAFANAKMDIYSQRLAGLSTEYESLRSMYNEAVHRNAVTELMVTDGRLSVAIRTIEGVDRVIETPFDPATEIYCDYVLTGGRLWIRRVYDAYTPPSQGLVIGDDHEHMDWNDPSARYGKAVYRELSEGRWIVTVTGDGSLGLAKAGAEVDVTLTGPPSVQDYDEIEKQIDDAVAQVTVGDVFKHIFTSGQ